MRISELENTLRKHAETTKRVMQAPFDLKESKNREEHVMHKPKSKRITKRMIAVAAVLTLCVVTVSVTPLANGVKGYFKDIIRFDGAITGTKYENATGDIQINVLEGTSQNGNSSIPLELTFVNPTEAPFPYIQELAMGEYEILDSTNKKIARVKLSPEEGDRGMVHGGKAAVQLPINEAELRKGEEYTIVIEKMYGLSKGDGPLHITGNWQCKFIK